MTECLDTQQLIARGKAALSAGAFETALQHFEEVVRHEPDYADVHNARGLCLARLDRVTEAICAFDKAISINDNYLEAHENRAEALQRAGRHQEAQSCLIRTLESVDHDNHRRYPPTLSAKLANMHSDLGDFYAEHGCLSEAAEQYRRACEIRPAFIDIRNKLARVLIDLGILEAAIRELRTALKVNPDFVEARANLGLALFRTGEIHEAKREWERSLLTRPDHSLTKEYLATLQETSASAPSAIESDAA